FGEDRRGQRLARRQETPERRERFRRLRRGVIEERPVGGGHGEEESRPLLGEELPRPRGREGVRREHDRGAGAEREVEARAEAIGEEEVGGRIAQVIRAQSEGGGSVAGERGQE